MLDGERIGHVDGSTLFISMNLVPSFVRRRIVHRPNLVKIVDNIGWLFLDKLVRLGLGLFVGVWLARYLGPEQFGLIGYATALVGLIGTFATLGLGNIIVRDLLRSQGGASVTLGTAAALQLVGGLAAFLLAALAIQFLRPDDALARMAVVILGSALVFRAAMTANFGSKPRCCRNTPSGSTMPSSSCSPPSRSR